MSAPSLVKRKLTNLPYRSASLGSDTIATQLKKKIVHRSKQKRGKFPEAITVLVGGTDFLTKQVVAFVRLANSQRLGNMTEVPLPVKFLFIMLGPQSCPYDYHEVGRAMATLMNNKVCNIGAYPSYNVFVVFDLSDCIYCLYSQSGGT